MVQLVGQIHPQITEITQIQNPKQLKIRLSYCSEST